MAEDLEQGLAEAVFIPPDNAGMEAVISALEKNVQAMIKADRKITSLKQLQVMVSTVFSFPHCHCCCYCYCAEMFLGPTITASGFLV